jgi:glycine cleavage system H protein
MSRKERDNQDRKQRSQKPQEITRRQFLKEASLVVGGAAIASLAFTSACSSPKNTTTSGNTTTTSTNTTPAITNTTTVLPPAEGFVYETPLEQPPKMPIPGCTTFTATDRKYVVEHMWVKMVAENIVAIGITEKMSELMDKINSLYLPKEGDILEKGGLFAYAEAAKMNVDFPAPVSGTVMQVNHDVYVDLEKMINDDPYVKGWLVTLQLSNPEEWDELLTPQEYTDLNSKVLE